MESGAAADVRRGRSPAGLHPFSLRCRGRADKGRRGSLRPARRHADHGRLRRLCGFFPGRRHNGAGILYDVAGTASIFSACTDFFAPDTENRTVLYAHSVIRDLWIPLAYISGGGLCLRWFRDTFLGASSGGSGYGLLEQEAAGVEPAAPDYILYRTLQAEPAPTIRRCGNLAGTGMASYPGAYVSLRYGSHCIRIPLI